MRASVVVSIHHLSEGKLPQASHSRAAQRSWRIREKMIQKFRSRLRDIYHHQQARRCDARFERVVEAMLKADRDRLRQVDYVEGLLRRVGLVRDYRDVYGADARFMNPVHRGLWQVPRQLAEFAVFLSARSITSFLEIGTFTGHTFNFLMLYLERFNPGLRGVTVDIADFQPVKLSALARLDAQFVIGTSENFGGRPFDLCLIDGLHSFDGVAADYEHVGRYAKICAFHDINDEYVEQHAGNDGGVPRFWSELKAAPQERELHEFLYHSDSRRIMGIGAAVRRE
jgi:hypothetical protein